MLTAVERKRLARAARELAGEFAEGVAPELYPYSYCGCAIAEIMQRGLGARPESNEDPAWRVALEIDALLPDDPALANGAEGLVSKGLRLELLCAPGAVVFPLLALATALDGKVL